MTSVSIFVVAFFQAPDFGSKHPMKFCKRKKGNAPSSRVTILSNVFLTLSVFSLLKFGQLRLNLGTALHQSCNGADVVALWVKPFVQGPEVLLAPRVLE